MDVDRPAVTPLDAFCLAHRIGTSQLANASDVSRQSVARLRYAQSDMCLEQGKKIARGASRILRRKVPVSELFDLDYEIDLSERFSIWRR